MVRYVHVSQQLLQQPHFFVFRLAPCTLFVFVSPRAAWSIEHEQELYVHRKETADPKKKPLLLDPVVIWLVRCWFNVDHLSLCQIVKTPISFVICNPQRPVMLSVVIFSLLGYRYALFLALNDIPESVSHFSPTICNMQRHKGDTRHYPLKPMAQEAHDFRAKNKSLEYMFELCNHETSRQSKTLFFKFSGLNRKKSLMGRGMEDLGMKEVGPPGDTRHERKMGLDTRAIT